MATRIFEQISGNPYYRKISLAYKKPEIRASTEIILSVFAVFFLAMTAIRPTLVTVAELQKKIEDQELVDKKITSKINSLVRAQTSLEEYADRLYLYEEGVPEGYSYSDLAKRIEIIANEEDLTIESLIFSKAEIAGKETIKPGEVDKKDSLATWVDGKNKVIEFEVKFEVLGDQEGVYGFISRIENMDRVMRVVQVDITRADSKKVGLNKLRASGQVRGYYLVSSADETN